MIDMGLKELFETLYMIRSFEKSGDHTAVKETSLLLCKKLKAAYPEETYLFIADSEIIGKFDFRKNTLEVM